MNCTCPDWTDVLKNHPDLFQEHPTYGNLLTWVEVSNEKTYHKLHNYGLMLKYCPFCGKELSISVSTSN